MIVVSDKITRRTKNSPHKRSNGASRKQPQLSRKSDARFLSPFRYPGGKSWFRKTVRRWIEGQNVRPKIIVEPFAGGASVSLAAVHDRLVDKAFFAERDASVAAAWKTILNGEAGWLANRIRKFRVSRRRVKQMLSRATKTRRNRAFQCLLQNRTARGGVIASGAGLLREGEDGNGLRSRWYADTLANRIATISSLKEKLKFSQGDGFKLIKRFLRWKRAVIFVDPPYTKAARRLYAHWKIDHERLFRLLSHAKGAVLMTYDDTAEVRALCAKYGFQFRRISMKTTHHEKKRELIIAKNFAWQKQLRSPTRSRSIQRDSN